VTWSPPDVLVLGAGGILGEAWMSAVLAGIEAADPDFDARSCRGFVGTSAGSIVAAALAGGVRPSDRLGRLPEQPPKPEGFAGSPAESLVRRGLATAVGAGGGVMAPLASVALSSTAAGGALLRRTALARVPRGRTSLGQLGKEMERLGVRWDGRLRVTAVELESGRRVVFGAPGAPEVSVADAVLASCAIPGVFRPLAFGGRTYVDGGAWSLTNMDACEAGAGDRVLCLNPTGAMRATLATPAAAIVPWSRTVAAAEALALRRRGARVDVVNPDRGSAGAMGSNLMDSRPRARVIEAGYEQGRRLAAASVTEKSHA
jgi:NTE family protein